MRVLAVLILVFVPVLAGAECPVPPDRSQEADALFAALADAGTEAEGQAAADRVWRFWLRAPDPRSQDWLDEGMSRIRMADYVLADRILTDLVAWCPGFAEGWNQRAFARFLMGDLKGSLEDVEATLALEPRHFGALSGKAHVLIAMGREDEAQAALRAAVAVHPWIAERFLLKDRGI